MISSHSCPSSSIGDAGSMMTIQEMASKAMTVMGIALVTVSLPMLEMKKNGGE